MAPVLHAAREATHSNSNPKCQQVKPGHDGYAVILGAGMQLIEASARTRRGSQAGPDGVSPGHVGFLDRMMRPRTIGRALELAGTSREVP